MEDKIYKWIYDWVAENFGESEADDPSWDIHALAEELDKHCFEIYRKIERDYLEEDCRYIAEQNGIELTDDEVKRVTNEFMDCDAYVDAHAEDWLYFMHMVKENK